MSGDTALFSPSVENPIDSVEEIMNANDWVFSRMNNDELMVQVIGKNCEYRMFFIWQEQISAMQFCCQYNFMVRADAPSIALALKNINENLWMGHFDIPQDTGIPTFRHTSLLRGLPANASADHIEDMVDIALTQCERHQSTFSFLAQGNSLDGQTLALALMETAGRS